ncbi:phage tail assembly chaperone [Bradyrhizobium barranii subsp. apii]|uniref:phage tail assembly chaperone n=1 Tax=Bradyrhizobium barranii TaxID=2992140 RepID=UPI001AA0D03F|nr:phage tail assembly chaperone [Bradyrhizobium barranii]UPT99383.1 phage tail assembly chaperone [Bradyrhizobium barranii subsp. apii]
MNIHYNVTTGQIMSHGSAAYECCSDSYLPGCKVLMRDYDSIDPKTEKIDLVLLEKVPKTEPDPFPMFDVKAAVCRELADTDKFVLPDFPISETERAAWIDYRKALRDASKGNDTAAAMLAAIPSRPDGLDGFEWPRSQLSASGI